MNYAKDLGVFQAGNILLACDPMVSYPSGIVAPVKAGLYASGVNTEASVHENQDVHNVQLNVCHVKYTNEPLTFEKLECDIEIKESTIIGFFTVDENNIRGDFYDMCTEALLNPSRAGCLKSGVVATVDRAPGAKFSCWIAKKDGFIVAASMGFEK